MHSDKRPIETPAVSEELIHEGLRNEYWFQATRTIVGVALALFLLLSLIQTTSPLSVSTFVSPSVLLWIILPSVVGATLLREKYRIALPFNTLGNPAIQKATVLLILGPLIMFLFLQNRTYGFQGHVVFFGFLLLVVSLSLVIFSDKTNSDSAPSQSVPQGKAKHFLKKMLWTRRIVWVSTASFLLWLLIVNFQPDGNWSARYVVSLKEPLKVFHDISSNEDVRIVGKRFDDGAYFQEIANTPITFSLPALRGWTDADIRVEFENPERQEEMSFGIKNANGLYETTTIYSDPIPLRTLSADIWNPMRTKDILLWQKIGAEQFGSLDEFFRRQPVPNRIARLRVRLPWETGLPGYEPSQQLTNIDSSFRGSHTIVTYIGEDENLDWQFFFRDINRHDDSDALKIQVSAGGERIHEAIITDDGTQRATGQVSEERFHHVVLERPGKGLYRINLQSTDDLFVTRFESQQHRWFFEDHYYPTDNEEYAVLFPDKKFSANTIFTDAHSLFVSTSHQGSLQRITVNRKTITLTQTHVPVEFSDLPSISTVRSERNDVLFKGGNFALNQENLFLPTLVKIDDVIALTKPLDDYDYIVARIPEFTVQNDRITARGSVSLRNADKNGLYSFSLNLPGLHKQNKQFRLYNLTVTLRRPPITIQNVFERLKKYASKMISVR